MKPVEAIITDSLKVLNYITETTPNYKKLKKKLKKMLHVYNENPEEFFDQYADSVGGEEDEI